VSQKALTSSEEEVWLITDVLGEQSDQDLDISVVVITTELMLVSSEQAAMYRA
jgi:hypothetical protein